ncbi:hypothetical protein CCP3SC1_860006 [Gammaproteobacteria bacterium]
MGIVVVEDIINGPSLTIRSSMMPLENCRGVPPKLRVGLAMFARRCRLFLCFLLLFTCSVGQALEVEGRATLAGNRARARAHALALEDALDRAHQPSLGPGGYTVIGEWVEGDTLILRIRIGAEEIHPRLALAQLYLAHPGSAEGGALAAALVSKLAERLIAGGQVVVTDPGHYQLIAPNDNTPLTTLSDAISVRRLATTTGAELVFSGVLWNMSREEIPNFLPWKEATVQYRLDLEVFFHEGVTGVVLDRQRLAVEFTGVDGSNGLVKDLADWVEATTAKRPLVASVLRVKGNLLSLDLPASSGLRSGKVVTVAPFNPLLLAPDRTNPATLLAPTGTTLTATVIQSQGLETTVKVPGNRLAPGDRVLIRPVISTSSPRGGV